MNLLSWNCRGLGNPRTIRNLCHLVEDKHPNILFLMETKLQRDKMSYVRGKLGFDNLFVVDCIGRSGGLALFWNNSIELEIYNYSLRHINAIINEPARNFQ
ncbi:hypothetical protein SLA2020_281850 [Shorea laevis]